MLTKLTDINGQTRHTNGDELLWMPGKILVAKHPRRKAALCTNTVLHCYEGGVLPAQLLDPLHNNFGAACRAFEVQGKIVVRDAVKAGARRLKVLREMPLVNIKTETRVRFAILCALQVYKDRAFNDWATAWLTGKNRSTAAAAWAAAEARKMVARAEAAAEWAARAATWAAEETSLDLDAIAEEAYRVEQGGK